MSNQPNCKICDSAILEQFKVKEMRYGTREIFNYNFCNTCHCLQIKDTPNDMRQYYKSDFYELNNNTKKFKSFKNAIRKMLIIWHPENLSFLFYFLRRYYPLFWIYRKLELNRKTTVLDVGAASGQNVIDLRSIGINSVGIDPFIDKDIITNGKLIVKKTNIYEVIDRYDVITFHHSFEHMPDQLRVLLKAKSLLKKDGKILIRIPTTSSLAFERFKENWFQLDAPRHLYLHSHKSIDLLAKSAKMKVKDLWCDSNEMQFIISEQYSRDIPYNDLRSYIVDPKESNFDRNTIISFKNMSKRANKENRGDQICIILLPE
jgi:2-polyprenyl-3-methyl-5-hydroxy-6-metoxy-1,4-benzoquinol methylase